MEVLGWRGYTWSAVVSLVGRTVKFAKMTLEAAYGREMNIKFSGNSSSGPSYSQHAKDPLELETSVALCCLTKLHSVAFYCTEYKVHLCNDHLLM